MKRELSESQKLSGPREKSVPADVFGRGTQARRRRATRSCVCLSTAVVSKEATPRRGVPERCGFRGLRHQSSLVLIFVELRRRAKGTPEKPHKQAPHSRPSIPFSSAGLTSIHPPTQVRSRTSLPALIDKQGLVTPTPHQSLHTPLLDVFDP